MAEGLAKKVLGPNFWIESAGSAPSTVNPYAKEVLLEVGIQSSGQYSKRFEDLPEAFRNNIHYVITLCQEEVCPVVPGDVIRIHWPLADPAAVPWSQGQDAIREAFRKTRNQISEKLTEFQNEYSKKN